MRARAHGRASSSRRAASAIARVLAAMRKVPRERFVDERMRERAYEDAPLPIGYGQTISQPYMVARMCELAGLQRRRARARDRRGLGLSGGGPEPAGAAGLRVSSCGPSSASAREQRLETLGYANVEVGVLRRHLRLARARAVRRRSSSPRARRQIPPLLVDQLADGGRLVIPVGPRQGQRLAIVTRRGDEFTTEWATPCSFVDLVGKYGWAATVRRARSASPRSPLGGCAPLVVRGAATSTIRELDRRD